MPFQGPLHLRFESVFREVGWWSPIGLEIGPQKGHLRERAGQVESGAVVMHIGNAGCRPSLCREYCRLGG